MAFTCKFEALDADTRGYLQAVRARKGRRTPGVYAGSGDAAPWVAVLLGPLAGLILFGMSFSGNKSPEATAMLQTAGVLVGGWPVWFAVRRWASGNSRWYGGRYRYFDPLHVYEVDGETVHVHSLEAVRGVEARGGAVGFDLGEHALAVPVGSATRATEVEAYYAAMAELESRPDGRWGQADPAELGAVAKYLAVNHEEPREISETGLEVTAVPRDPDGGGRAKFGLGGVLLILAAGAGLFLAFSAVNVPLGDAIAFQRAKEGGAPGLRTYLLDPKTTAHREEAKQLLSALYTAPIDRLKRLEPGAKPELREGLVKMLEELRTSVSPVVSIRVTDEAPDGGDATTALRSEVADGLARSIGPELIAFVSPPDDKPAHLTIKYKLPPAKEAVEDVPQVAALTVEVRPTLEAAPAAASWLHPLKVNPGLAGLQRSDILKQELCKELVGEWKPTPVNGGGGF